jgi:hypothetical protein
MIEKNAIDFKKAQVKSIIRIPPQGVLLPPAV